MITPDDCYTGDTPAPDRKPTRLENALGDDQTVLEHVTRIRTRLAEMEVRLFGDQVATGDDEKQPFGAGIFGQFSATNASTMREIEKAVNSLVNIEAAI